jgi:hypothetical protein
VLLILLYKVIVLGSLVLILSLTFSVFDYNIKLLV